MMSLNFRAIVWHWTTLLFIEGYPSCKMYVRYSVSDCIITIVYSKIYRELVRFFLKKALVWSRSELRTRQFRKPRFRPTSTKMTLLQSLYHGVAKRTSTLILAIGVTAFGFERGKKENFLTKEKHVSPALQTFVEMKLKPSILNSCLDPTGSIFMYHDSIRRSKGIRSKGPNDNQSL